MLRFYELDRGDLFQFAGFSSTHFYNDEVYEVVAVPDLREDGMSLEDVADKWQVRKVADRHNGSWRRWQGSHENVNYMCYVKRVKLVLTVVDITDQI